MTSASNRPEPDLGERLRELEAPETPGSTERMDQMFSKVKTECDQSDRSLSGFLRSRSTVTRRMLVLSVFATLALIGWFAFPLVGDQARTIQWAVSLVSFCVLILLAMFMVTRPVHLPALPRWQSLCLVCIALGATVVAALWPHPAAQAATHEHVGNVMAGACMGVGLLLGIPVYALLRLVDRGNAFGSLVAAAAAGVAGNFVLKAHCAVPGTSHELLGHASVAVLFVVGLGLVHRFVPTK